MHPTVAVPHNFSVSKAHKAQSCLSQKVVAEDHLPKKIHRVAGVDVAYAGDFAISAAAVLDYDSLELLERQTATSKVSVHSYVAVIQGNSAVDCVHQKVEVAA